VGVAVDQVLVHPVQVLVAEQKLELALVQEAAVDQVLVHRLVLAQEARVEVAVDQAVDLGQVHHLVAVLVLQI